jgi:hypothetical protein
VSDKEHYLYVLGSPPYSWGDYGNILVAGMTSHLEREDGRLQLERTGPFVPPIALPGIGEIVITDVLRSALEASGLSGMHFQSVIKTRIVRLNWEAWDATAPEPQEYPDTGEPEDYILLRPHDADLSVQMGDLWEICLEQHARTERISRTSNTGGEEIHLIRSSWDGTDVFRAEGVSFVYVSDKAKSWFEATVPEWVTFAALGRF